MVLPEIGINMLVGAGVGVGAGIVGFTGNHQMENFKFGKFFPTVLTGGVAGAISGLVSPDWRTAATAALGADVLRKATRNYIDQGAVIAAKDLEETPKPPPPPAAPPPPPPPPVQPPPAGNMGTTES